MHLLAKPRNFGLQGALYVFFKNLCLPLPLVSILRLLFDTLVLFPELVVSILEILRSYPAVLKRELQVMNLLDEVLYLASLLSG